MALEIRAPFDPEAAVGEFAATLRRYGVDRVVGDRYGGEWPRQRFREHGIAYEPSARPKSDLYLGLLPLLTTGRVELLDMPRLTAQLVNLERRTARSGKDSVDHILGGHDDIANSVAGVLVSLDLDRRPSLIRADDLRSGAEAVPWPKVTEVLCAVLWVAADGTAATIFFSYDSVTVPGMPPLMILDFDASPLSGKTIITIARRIAVLSEAIVTRLRGRCLIWLPDALVYHATLAGVDAAAIPQHILADPAGLALSAAANVSAGRVKICDPAAEKARNHPLGGALNFRAGEKMDADPLRLAALLAIEMTLGDERARVAAQ